ncbi:hypothetical protein L7F22_031180 [Adiantum nelumboides]|nr:hypothetical protein [Adiantum nelumboides]
MGNVASGPPPEKTITLSSLSAPRLARRGGQDDPFAWESREFLRKRCIGEDVIFRVDYVVPSINREFGSVFIGKANLALEVVGAGWAKVRSPMGQNNGEVSAYLEELEQLEQQAKEKGLGMWNRAPGAVEKAVRDLPPSAVGDSANFDATSFADAKHLEVLPAIVEQVRDGGTVRVYLLPEFQYVQVFATGIQSPSMGRRAMVHESQTPTVNGEQESADAGNVSGSSGVPLTTAQRLAASTASVEVPPEPYAREAKHFTEVRVLHRDVRIVVQGADKFGNLIGSVHYPRGDVAVDLALELLQNGLAKVVEWSARLLDEDAKRTLKNAELTAKKEKLRLWTNFVPPASNSTAIRDDNFKGRVVEVVSGDCIIVADDAAPYGSLSAERRVNLSSIRAPKMGNAKKGEKPADYAREAKEFLRTRLIGQEVNVVMEYSRKVMASDGPTPDLASGDVRNMDFGSVFLPSTSKVDTSDLAPALPAPGQPEGINVAELVVARGFATVVRHRDFEDRSNHYDALLAAETRAKKGKKTIHSEKKPAPDRINDLTMPAPQLQDASGAKAQSITQKAKQSSPQDASGPKTQSIAQRAKQFLPFLQRAKRLPAVVDYVLSGHRYKILIPRETCAIFFSLSGVRCPGRGEPYAEDAIGFMRRKILQREVEIEVEAVDKTGTFLGSLWESKTNVAVLLLEAGLAKLHPFFSADRTTEGHLLVQTEERAKKEKKKVWENYIEGKEEENAASLNDTKQNQEVLKVKVTEVLGGGKFYVQLANDARVSSIQMQLEGLRVKEKALPPVNFEPKKGEIVMAEFSADCSWNRSMVVNAPWQAASKDGYEVFYIDYGNQEKVPLSRLRPLDSSISFGTPGLALLLNFAYVRIPELEEDYGQEAAEYLSSLIGDKVFMAKVMEKDTSGGKVKGQGTGTKLSVFLYDVDPGKSINSLMLQAGYARIVKKNRWDPKEKQEELEKLGEFQEGARKQRLNIWQYGDFESDEEDNAPARPNRR